MLVGHRAMVRAEQPPLQERDDPVDMRQKLRGRLGLSLEKRDPMTVAVTSQRLVTHPPVGMDEAAGLHRLLNKGHQARPGRIGHPAHPDSTHAVLVDLHRNSYEGFGFQLPSSPAGMHASD